jgi:hypothetical protein
MTLDAWHFRPQPPALVGVAGFNPRSLRPESGSVRLVNTVERRSVVLLALPFRYRVGVGYAMQCPDLRSSCSAWA